MGKLIIIIKKIKGLFETKKPILSPPFFTKDILLGDVFEIGDYTYGHPKVKYWNNETKLKIGKFCSIADDVIIILGGNHRIDWISTYPFDVLPKLFPKSLSIKGHPSSKGDIIIGNDVWIGHSAILLSGITIADGAVVAAGAVVNKNIGSYEVWGGNPVKFIRKRFSEEIIQQLLREKWWNWTIENINNNINNLCSEPK